MSVFGVFLSVFSRIRSEYRNLHSKSPYSVEMRANVDQKNSEYRHFAGIVWSAVHHKSVFTISQCLPVKMKFTVI